MDPKPGESTPFDLSSAAPVAEPPPEIVTEDPLEYLRAEILQLHERGTSGANWFFWIAALSLVNSLILLSDGERHFVVGLGVTLVSDSIAVVVARENPDIAMIAKSIAFGFALCVAGGVCLFGWLSRRAILPIFALGMILYLLDALIYLLVGDWMSVGFHGFALFCMWGGFAAFQRMKAIRADLERRLAAPA